MNLLPKPGPNFVRSHMRSTGNIPERDVDISSTQPKNNFAHDPYELGRPFGTLRTAPTMGRTFPSPISDSSSLLWIIARASWSRCPHPWVCGERGGNGDLIWVFEISPLRRLWIHPMQSAQRARYYPRFSSGCHFVWGTSQPNLLSVCLFRYVVRPGSVTGTYI